MGITQVAVLCLGIWSVSYGPWMLFRAAERTPKPRRTRIVLWGDEETN